MRDAEATCEKFHMQILGGHTEVSAAVNRPVTLKHPYPTIVDKINKYGYDPKQLHHILRMNDFIKKYAVLRKPYKECLIPDNKEYLINIKKGILSEEEATKLAIETDGDTYDVKTWATGFDLATDEINQKGLDVLEKTKYEILKMRFREELKIK